MNYSTVSEPHCSTVPNTNHHIESAESLPTLQNCSHSESKAHGGQIRLDKFDEEEWEASVNSSLPTEFDLRPDLTPTGEENNTISFETPIVRSSPSQMSHNSSASNDDSDETLEQVSEIVDQTPSTYQPQREVLNSLNIKKKNADKKCNKSKMSCGKKMLAVLCTSILSALIIIIMLTCLVIIILEIDSNVFQEIRQLPEMILFNREYYQPFKESILKSIKSREVFTS